MDLKELLLERYEDAQGQMRAYDYGTDEYTRLERESQKLLDQLIKLEEGETKLKIEQLKIEASASENEKARTHEKEMAEESFNQKYESDYKIESMRHDHNMDIERLKRKENASRIAIEVGKILIPTVVPIVAYNLFQKRILKFEETGRLSSTAARELHLPKFFK